MLGFVLFTPGVMANHSWGHDLEREVEDVRDEAPWQPPGTQSRPDVGMIFTALWAVWDDINEMPLPPPPLLEYICRQLPEYWECPSWAQCPGLFTDGDSGGAIVASDEPNHPDDGWGIAWDASVVTHPLAHSSIGYKVTDDSSCWGVES